MDTQSAQPDRIRLAADARDQADVVLRTLIEDRRWSEERFAENGKHDPLKNLTGESSLDRAVASTKEMIAHMDKLLAELRADSAKLAVNGSTNGHGSGPAQGATIDTNSDVASSALAASPSLINS